MKLILMRHGQSGGNVGLKGDEFDRLTLRGVKQAEEAGKKIKNRKIKVIYCSPVGRCVQTLDEILEVKKKQVPANLSRLIKPKLKKEKLEELQKRVILFLEDLKCELEEDEEALVISHLPVVKMFEYEITGKADFWENGEIKEFDYSR